MFMVEWLMLIGWSFIAPFFAKTHRVIAMNLSGMGDSEWRENYASELWG